MKTLASIMLLFSLSAMATPSFAMGTALKQTSQLQVKSAPKTTRPSFELKKTNYKRTKYPNVRLLGPIDFSIEEDYSVRLGIDNLLDSDHFEPVMFFGGGYFDQTQPRTFMLRTTYSL